jgi:hypothetical protein
MKNRLSSTFAIIVGLFLLVEGIAGLDSPMVFTVFATNQTHAIIHILLGATGIGLGAKGNARGYCVFLGILLLFVGIFFFVPFTFGIIVDLLNVNPPVAYLNIIIGAVALLVAYVPSQKPRTMNTGSSPA